MSSDVNWYTARLLGISDTEDDEDVQVLEPVKQTPERDSEDPKEEISSYRHFHLLPPFVGNCSRETGERYTAHALAASTRRKIGCR